jgi:methionyl-tRNA formyltransferase
LKLAFAGTPAFAATALRELHAAGFDIPLVLTQPDRPAGRGMKLQASPVKAFALAHRIALVQPRSLRLDGKAADEAAATQAALLAAAPDVIVVAAYGLILPAWVLTLPRLGCINIHASLLPRWRGAAPIQRAIEAGDTQTGITIMQMDAGLDTGDMLLVESLGIAADDSAATLHDRLAVLGARMIFDALTRLAKGPLARTAQPGEGVSYAHKIEKAEAMIDWHDRAAVIERRLRAFDPFPGAAALLGGEVLKCWRGRVGTGRGEPGEVLSVADDGISVACGAGSLLLTELQRPGGKRLPAREFLHGLPIAPGQRFAPRPR